MTTSIDGRALLTCTALFFLTAPGCGTADVDATPASGFVGVTASTTLSLSGPARAWRPFSDASPWNTPIAPNAVVDPQSTALIADMATSSPWPWLSINIASYSIPVYEVDDSTALQRVNVTTVGGHGFNSGAAMVPIPLGATAAIGTDAHLAIVNRATQQEWGLWAASRNVIDGRGWTAEVAAVSDLSGTGVRPPTAHAPWWMGVGARACGFPLSAGLITVDDLAAGAIEHALVIAYPHIRAGYYTSPASTAQAAFATATRTRGMPCGTRIQLRTWINVETMGLSHAGKIVARALQKYGAFVGDFSGAVSLYADASPAAQSAWSAGLLKGDELRTRLPIGSFRALANGPLFDNGN